MFKLYRKVAPYVGAWIETYQRQLWLWLCPVAPYVGAWIETLINAPLGGTPKSHPTWVRGLKQRMVRQKY